jgi:hypothetical protein
LREEIGYLSPYLLPWPLTERSAIIDDFEERGFSSVVELPLTSSAAVALTERKLAEVTADSVLFLDNLKSLTIATPNGARTFERSIMQREDGHQKLGYISIGSAQPARTFSIWRCRMQVSNMPAEVQDSIRGLPGQWPKLKHAEIAVAVSDDQEPSPGKLSIFLPTALETGAALHINAPFFGDMSRTTISFDTEEEGAQAGGPTTSSYCIRLPYSASLQSRSIWLDGPFAKQRTS